MNDATADTDGDGLDNIIEFRLRSAANARDTDSNGVEDGVEDADGDGVPNAVEIALGTNPTNDGIRTARPTPTATASRTRPRSPRAPTPA